MKKIAKKDIYRGNLFKCVSYPTTACTFLGVVYEEKIVYENILFVKLKEGSFAGLDDLLENGRKAVKFTTKAKTVGDYFVKDLVALKQQEIEFGL